MAVRAFTFLGFLVLVAGAGFAGCGTSRDYKSGNQGGSAGGGAGGTGGTAGTAGKAGKAGTGGGGSAGASGEGGSSDDCSADDVRCNDQAPERCSEEGVWQPARASCAVACLNGACVTCANGTKTCKDGAVQSCVAGVWTTDQVCPKACEDEACVEACTEGRYQCNGTRVRQKCVGGEYVDEEECEFSCSEGACVARCAPDDLRCNPDATGESQVCDAQGSWGASTPCASGTFCVDGGCRPCAPEATRCSNAGPQRCSDAGEWVNQGACSGSTPACFEGKCVACTPEDKRCADNAVEVCDEDGSGWEVVETCSGDTPACLDQTKACGRCTDGDKQCVDDAVQTCNDEGVFETTETCSDATPRCVGDECAACDPDSGERRCADSTSTQSCASDGTWAEAVPCEGDTPTCREELGFDCGCEESARRCRSNSTTVPEVCQGGAWVAQSACSGTLDYCLPATGECVDCVPGAAECKSGVAHQCNDAGVFESLNSCSGPGINCGNCGIGESCEETSECRTGFCVNGKCAVCEPEDRDCVGTTPRLCASDGTWQNQTGCTGATPECLASTGQCVACLNNASRSCGNCNTGMQTCSNNQWGSCSGAVDLDTSEQHCGECGNACSSSQVCEDGDCVVDCDDLTRCGSSCVNTATDTSNCLGCGNKCNPPSANGSAVCTATGCDISCTNTRCGTSCCEATPARSTAGCSGNSCMFTCSSGNHGCGNSMPPCYANSDATHCGSSCVNCSAHVGTTGTCTSNQCACESSSALACGDSVPTCGSWDFNSGVEGWKLGDWADMSSHHWTTTIGTTTINGSPALRAGFDGTASDGGVVEFEVDLCQNGAVLNLANYNLSYKFYFLTSSGLRFNPSDSDSNDTLLANNNSVITGCQPFKDVGTDAWIEGGCSNLPATITNLTLVFRIGQAWAGTVYIEDVKLTPKP